MSETEELLSKLAIRLVTFFGDPNVENPQLLVGNLPKQLPVHVPMPEGSHVLGTLVRGPRSLHIVLEVPLSMSETRDFYARELKAQGWESPEGMPGMGMRHGGGFASGFAHIGSVQVYIHSSGVSLNVQIAGEGQGLSDVRLLLSKDAHMRAVRMRQQRMAGPDIFSILPLLQPPDGARQMAGGSGSGGNEVHTHAVLILKDACPITEVVRHYAEQLVKANWTQIDAEVAVRSAWSAWTFIDEFDEQWHAAFSLFNLPGEQIRYHLNLRAELKDVQSFNL
jgi:hypothetical protein